LDRREDSVQNSSKSLIALGTSVGAFPQEIQGDKMFCAPFKRILAAVIVTAATAGHAFPDKPVTMIVPFVAGSSTDVIARELAQVLSQELKQPILADNRTGAEGSIAGTTLLNAQPDGHTFLFTSSSLPVLDPLMRKNVPFDFARDFAPVCSVARSNILLNISGASPFKSVGDLVAAAKAAPGKLTFAYSSATTRLAGELFQQAGGVKFTGIPYRSSVNGLTDLAGGQVDMFFIDHIAAGAYYQSGKVRPLVVSGAERIKSLPDVPSATEAGVPGYRVFPWYGIYVSSKVPASVLTQFRAAMSKTLALPAVTALLAKRGLLPFAQCGEELARFQADDVALWRRVTTGAGIQPE
jgi:tripartite-type tricarboxylate transporter receptor subunit TctC